MKKQNRNLPILSCLVLLSISSCKVDEIIVEENSGYSQEIGEIMLTKCAVTGCHTDISKEAAAGLSLESWEKMMQGGNNGAITIPYNHEQSPLFLFTNTYSELGVSIEPSMPMGNDSLSKNEMEILLNWIENGAPNKDGIVKFSDDRKRKKIYVTNQGCDLVSVIDEESGLIMRYIEVGNSENIESPHMIRVSPDGNYWYVVFTNGSVVQKYNAIDDSFVAEAEISYGSWNTIAISEDSKTAFAVDWNANGRIACIDLESMSLKQMYQGSGLLIYPHGISLYDSINTAYVTAQSGNFIYKINYSNINSPIIEEITLVPGESPSTISSLDPHEIIFSPDKSTYFVSCQKSNEVRVMNTENDSLIAIIPTGQYPVEFSLCTSLNYLLVSCMEDTLFFPNSGRGCISVISLQNLNLITSIYSGYQPHGLAVNEDKQTLYVAHRNLYSDGPAPHHTTACGGRNGYMTIIDLSSLKLTEEKFELSVDPYSLAIRKK